MKPTRLGYLAVLVTLLSACFDFKDGLLGEGEHGTQCQSDSDCSSRDTCGGTGYCTFYCKSDADCEIRSIPGTTCNPGNGGCVSPPGSGPPNSGIALADLPAQVAKTLCHKSFKCCTAAERMNGHGPATETECVSQTIAQAMAQSPVATLQASIDAGRLVYHPGDATEILSAVSEMTCADFAVLISARTGIFSEDWFEGRVAVGGACTDPNECVSGYCEYEATTSDSVCKTRPSAGAACPNNVCVEGFYCPQDSSGSDRTMQPMPAPTCVPAKSDGMSCLHADECVRGGCNGSDPTSDIPGTCGAPMICDGL